MKRGFYLTSIFLILLISLASAGLFDFTKTGKASFGNQDVRINVVGTNPPIIDQPSASISAQNPTEAGITQVDFNVVVTDIDGVANIVDSSLIARVSRGAVTRTATCINPTNIDSDTKSYNCTTDMQYYDSAGGWDLYVGILDQEANNGTRTINPFFNYNTLYAMQVPLSPSTLEWPSLSTGASNTLSNNDPTTVTNTGNYAGNIFITGYDLQGETNGAEIIPANLFSVDSATGGVPSSECNVGITAVPLGADATKIDTGINANPGQSGANIANVYYCITSVPFVSSQAYSTSIRGPAFSWTVSYQ